MHYMQHHTTVPVAGWPLVSRFAILLTAPGLKNEQTHIHIYKFRDLPYQNWLSSVVCSLPHHCRRPENMRPFGLTDAAYWLGKGQFGALWEVTRLVPPQPTCTWTDSVICSGKRMFWRCNCFKDSMDMPLVLHMHEHFYIVYISRGISICIIYLRKCLCVWSVQHSMPPTLTDLAKAAPRGRIHKASSVCIAAKFRESAYDNFFGSMPSLLHEVRHKDPFFTTCHGMYIL